MSTEFKVTAPIYTLYSANHIKRVHELKALLNAAKERISELELFIDDIENDNDLSERDCDHEDDEIISDWVAYVVGQARFKGAQYLIDEIEQKAAEGRVVFSKELKDAFHVK